MRFRNDLSYHNEEMGMKVKHGCPIQSQQQLIQQVNSIQQLATLDMETWGQRRNVLTVFPNYKMEQFYRHNYLSITRSRK